MLRQTVMDVFLAPDEIAVRQRVRDYFRDHSSAVDPSAGAMDGEDAPELVLKGVGLAPRHGELLGAGPGHLQRVLIIEEVARVSPKLGRRLFSDPAAPPALLGPEDVAASTAWLMGVSAAIYAACLGAAREAGFFESTLMDHQKVQQGLADLLADLEAARLQAYRALRLIDRGEKERGQAELGRASRLAEHASENAIILAVTLLGQGWLAARLPASERSRE